MGTGASPAVWAAWGQTLRGRCSPWRGPIAQLEGRCWPGAGQAPQRMKRTEVRDTTWMPSGFLPLTCSSAWAGVFRGLPCPWLWWLFASRWAATLQLTSCKAGGLWGHQRVGLYLHGLCLFITSGTDETGAMVGLGSYPIKTAFRPHLAGNLGTRAG